MCEEKRVGICMTPCSICVVEGCDTRENSKIDLHGCGYGKPSNDIILWAFEFTNKLRNNGVSEEASISAAYGIWIHKVKGWMQLANGTMFHTSNIHIAEAQLEESEFYGKAEVREFGAHVVKGNE